MDIRVGSEGHALVVGLRHFYGAFLLGFLWLIILLFLVLSLYLVYLGILPSVHVYLSAKIDLSISSSKEAYG